MVAKLFIILIISHLSVVTSIISLLVTFMTYIISLISLVVTPGITLVNYDYNHHSPLFTTINKVSNPIYHNW